MKTMKFALSLVAALLLPLADLQAAKPLNILFFTADDMNYDSSGVCSGPIKELTCEFKLKLVSPGIYQIDLKQGEEVWLQAGALPAMHEGRAK